ncbi:MAG: diacylglycerol/lipid kinase family protein [Solirubrobacterales bacterium]
MTADANRRHALLVNPSSGQGRSGELLPEVERELGNKQLAYRLVATRSLEHGAEEALAAAAAGEVPVVMSGDGLIGAIGGALAGSDTPLGVIPGGRGNDFARTVGIPTEVPEAVAVLAAGEERRIDVGEVNGKRFLSIASCGFDSEANRRANETRVIRGNLVYAYAALRTLATWRPAAFTVTIDGEAHEFTGFSAAVANGTAYGGGMLMAPDAELEDGLFDVVMSATVSKRRFLANLPKVFKGAHVEEDEVTVLRGSEVEITADREFEVYADGEPLTELPAKLRVLPRALRVIAPPTR